MRLFLDFEASSMAEVYLIAPAPDWHDWSTASETIHGISRERLAREGTPAREVAARLLEALASADVAYSDAPGWDQAWLNTLLVAAGHGAPFPTLKPIEDLWAETLRPWLGMQTPAEGKPDAVTMAALARAATALVEDVRAAECSRRRIRHRALADADGLRWRWLELRDRVRLLTGE